MRISKYKEKVTEEAFSKIMLTSLCGFIICTVCLCASTWAWYSTNQVSGYSSIISAGFAVSVEIADEDAPQEVSAYTGGEISLTQEGRYIVTITSIGSAKGYCRLTIDGVPEANYIVKPEASGSSVSFMLVVPEGGYSLRVEPVMGITEAAANLNEGDDVDFVSAPGAEG